MRKDEPRPQVRAARPADLPVIRQIIDAPENHGKLATYPDAVLLSAMALEDQMMLVLDAAASGPQAFLWIVGLRSDPVGPKIEEFGALRPGCGVGGALFDAGLAAIITSGAERLWLAVAADNVGAIRFYERRAFQRVSVRRQAWHRRAGPVADALIMARDLSSPKAGTVQIEATSLVSRLDTE